METKEFMKLIVKIRKDRKTKSAGTFIKKYILKNFEKLKKEPNQLILLFKEGSNKTKTNTSDLVTLFFIFSDFQVKNKEDEEIIDNLSLLFNKSTWKYISTKFVEELSFEFMTKHLDKIIWYVL